MSRITQQQNKKSMHESFKIQVSKSRKIKFLSLGNVEENKKTVLLTQFSAKEPVRYIFLFPFELFLFCQQIPRFYLNSEQRCCYGHLVKLQHTYCS